MRYIVLVGVDRRDERLQGTSRLIRLHEDDGAFDRAFWAAMSPAERVEAAWDMVVEYLAWKTPDVGEPRLQRSVCRLERGRG